MDKKQNMAIGQGKAVQFFGNYGEIENSDVSSSLLTEFNSNVRKIIFNKKRNLVIAYSEDDDIHITNLNTMETQKFK